MSPLDDTPPPVPPPLRSRQALFLDFDGTLAPIQLDPDTVRLVEGCEAALLDQAHRLGGALAIISGRDVRDLSARLPAGLWRAGAHGLEVCAPYDRPADRPPDAPDALLDALERLVALESGVRLEVKGPVLAVHYRARPELETDLLARVDAIVAEQDDYVMQAGKCVVEAKPFAANKGRAIRSLLASPPFRGRQPVMVGDDATDEDAFEAVEAFGGWSVKVGDGPSRAAWRLDDPQAVARWLAEPEA